MGFQRPSAFGGVQGQSPGLAFPQLRNPRFPRGVSGVMIPPATHDAGRETMNADSNEPRTARVSGEEALALHAAAPAGKLATRITKPLTTARDLSLAYSPGVAEPCLRIFADPATVYDYTTRGNMVAVISN